VPAPGLRNVSEFRPRSALKFAYLAFAPVHLRNVFEFEFLFFAPLFSRFHLVQSSRLEQGRFVCFQ
jgi:hypothetical protein